MRYHQFIAGWDAEDKSFRWQDGRVWQNGAEVFPQAVFDDDLLDYLYDTFQWIRARYPNGTEGTGLGSEAYAVIGDRGEIRKLLRLARAWQSLFDIGPERIALTGNYGWTVDLRKGSYESLNYCKEELIGYFNDLIEVAENALENGMYLIHLQNEEEDGL